MLKWYPGLTREEVWDELPMAEGYAYLTVGISLDGWMQFNGVVPEEGQTYLEQEVAKLMKEAKRAWALK